MFAAFAIAHLHWYLWKFRQEASLKSVTSIVSLAWCLWWECWWTLITDAFRTEIDVDSYYTVPEDWPINAQYKVGSMSAQGSTHRSPARVHNINGVDDKTFWVSPCRWYQPLVKLNVWYHQWSPVSDWCGFLWPESGRTPILSSGAISQGLHRVTFAHPMNEFDLQCCQWKLLYKNFPIMWTVKCPPFGARVLAVL